MNKVCYTGLFSDYEELKTPSIIPDGWTFYCFTDQPITSDVWKIIPTEVEEGLTPQRMARKIKLLPHIYLPEYEYTFWLDASFQINVDLNTFWNKYFKGSFCCPSHPLRTCVYQEIRNCIVCGRGDETELRKQGDHYKKIKVPEFNGIITSGVLMRQRTIGCVHLCNDWWEELCKHSARDQVAFANVSRRWHFHTFKWDYSQARDLKYIRHYNRRPGYVKPEETASNK